MRTQFKLVYACHMFPALNKYAGVILTSGHLTEEKINTISHNRILCFFFFFKKSNLHLVLGRMDRKNIKYMLPEQLVLFIFQINSMHLNWSYGKKLRGKPLCYGCHACFCLEFSLTQVLPVKSRLAQ